MNHRDPCERVTTRDYPDASADPHCACHDPASWAMEVQTGGDDWNGNGVRLATKEECDSYGLNKAMTWTMVSDVRSVPSEDPVNYRWSPECGLERRST